MTEAKSLSCLIVSDIHSEFHKTRWLIPLLPLAKDEKASSSGIDAVILAGDIGSVCSRPEILRSVLSHYRDSHPGARVVMVPGNHEYYGCGFNRGRALELLSQMCAEEDIALLCRSSTTIKGFKFIGATLWSNIENHAFEAMNDSKHVFRSSHEMKKEHREDVKWLSDNIHDADVVVTHHVPSRLLISDEFKNHPLNSGFVTPGLAESMTQKCLSRDVSKDKQKERLWVCGHTHRPMTANLEGFGKLVVNPFGYPGELESCPQLIVDLFMQH